MTSSLAFVNVLNIMCKQSVFCLPLSQSGLVGLTLTIW